jgi:hypothetical protein
MQSKGTLQRLVEAARRFTSALVATREGQQSAQRPGLALGALRTRRRLVLVFAPRADIENLEVQRAILAAGRKQLEERDTSVVFVVGDEITAPRGTRIGMSAVTLRARFGVPGNAFRVILVGKDAGAKLRSNKPLQAETLIATIDALPLRQQEQRHPGQRGGPAATPRSSLKGRSALRK